MPEIERLSAAIEWIDLSFVERARTPNWAIYEAIRCHLGGMSLRDVSVHLEMWGIDRSHVAVHNWVHNADLQPDSTVTAVELAVDEKAIRINGHDYWLYAAVDPATNEFLHVRLFPVTTKQTTRWFLADLHQRYQLDGVQFLVDDADYLVEVLRDDGYDFAVVRHGLRNSIERVFREVQRRTSSFANSFSHVAPSTAESWLETFAVYHNARQT
jgi:transposase-like protein